MGILDSGPFPWKRVMRTNSTTPVNVFHVVCEIRKVHPTVMNNTVNRALEDIKYTMKQKGVDKFKILYEHFNSSVIMYDSKDKEKKINN